MNTTTRLNLNTLDERIVPANFPITLAGGGVSWVVDNAGGIDPQGVADNSPGLRLVDATVDDSGRTDAFDSAGVFTIDGQPLTVTDDATVSGATLTTSPVTVSGLTVTVQYAALPGSPTLRTWVTLQNPSASAIVVPVTWSNNLGSDAATTITATSSGDGAFTAADRWVVTDDADATSGKPAVLNVLAGAGQLPGGVSQTVFQNSGTEGIRADYTVTIPAGATRSLLFFQQVRDDRAAQNVAAAGFNANLANTDALFAGLNTTQLGTVSNWDFTAPPTGTSPLPPVVPPVNANPTLSQLSIADSNEGSPATLRGTITDDASGPFSLRVTWGDGTEDTFTVQSGDFNFNHIYTTDVAGNYPVALTVTDAGGATTSGNISAVVRNVAPTINGLTTTLDGASATLSGTVVDPGTSDGVAVTVTWGDGASERITLANAGPFRLTHRYTGTNAAGYAIRVTADDGVDTSATTTTAVIGNNPPSITNLRAATTGRTTTLTADVADFESDGQLTLSIDWGDGQTEQIALPLGATNFTQTHDYAGNGKYTVRTTLTDIAGATATAGTTVELGLPATNSTKKFLAVGSGAGAAPTIMLLDPATRAVLRTMAPFEMTFTGGIRVTTADLNNDGIDDIIAGAGVGGGPRVIAIDGATAAILADFFAYDTDLRGGVFIAAADLDGDGMAEIITGAGAGGAPHVRIFDGATRNLRKEFLTGSPDSRGGVSVAVTGDEGGPMTIVVGSGVGEVPNVQLLDPTTGSYRSGFQPFEPQFLGGVDVSTADLDRDGIADIISAAGPTGGPRIMVHSGRDLGQNRPAEISNFFVGDSESRNGVRVGHADTNADGTPELLAAASNDGRLIAFNTTTVNLTPPPELASWDLGTDLHGIFVG
jgi:PKD domain